MSIKELGYTSMLDLKKEPDKLIGKECSTNGFMSTAKDKEATAHFFAPRSVVVKFTHSKIPGLDISQISHKKDEKEVLFPKGTIYKITKCEALYDADGDFMNFEIEAKIIDNKYKK